MIENTDFLSVIHHPLRPNTPEYIQMLFPDFIEMHGDRFYGDDLSVIGGIASFKGVAVTVIGHVKGRNLEERLRCNFSMSKPEGYRKILRLMKQAEKFRRPVICFVDTMGAYPGKEAEERGQGNAIANCLAEAVGLRTQVISILLGDGGSGGALALCIADYLIALEHATLGVISPRACANILWKDSTREREAAEFLHMNAQSLYEFGVVDQIIEEPNEGAHTDPQIVADRLAEIIGKELKRLTGVPVGRLVRKRKRKYREIGSQFLLRSKDTGR
jgi:acetyl-CoA carboxylase carboxyl transferase subunit alpha